LLFGEIGGHTGDRGAFKNAIHYYEKAFDSRPFNTAAQKARALRGIGFIQIELGEFEKAKEVYEASLTWEESEIARTELKIIANRLSNPDAPIFKAGSNFNDTQNIRSIQYFDEAKEKIPITLQNKIPNNYAHIWSKATLLTSQGFKEYRQNDLFNFPLKEWNEPEMLKCNNQIVHYLKGIDPSHYIETDNIEEAKNLLLTFHFESMAVKQILNEKNEKIQVISFKHKVENEEITLYFKTNNTKIKKKWWGLW